MNPITSKQRLLTAIQHQEADRVPVGPHVPPAMVAQMSGEEW